jgi:hypothetical protein
MVTFQCETKGCGHILLNSSKRYAYELAGFTCPKCHKTGAWKNYTGEIHEAVLAREDVRIVGLKQKLLLALAERDRLKIEFDQACAERRNCELAYNALHNPDIPTIVSELKKIERKTNAAVVAGQRHRDAEEAAAKLDSAIDDLGNRDAVNRDAGTAYRSAASVEAASQKNKLYIGNRQYVSQHRDKGPLKKFRILDVPNWSPGLNVAWVEGGISAKAHFKIKLDSTNQYANIPDAVLDKFKDVPAYDAEDFLALCKTDGKNSLLWFDKDGYNRPTWTALEIWCLLRKGYSFQFGDSKKDGKGRKIVLTPPA